ELGPVVSVSRRTMKLHQIQAVRGEIAEAVFDKRAKVLFVVSVRGVRVEAAPGLGGDHDFLFTLALELRDQALTAAHSVDVRGIDEIHAAIDGLVEGGDGLRIVHRPPGAADGPCSETDIRDLPTSTSEFAIV